MLSCFTDKENEIVKKRNELLNKVDCGQSTLCFHLKTLVNVNLLRQRKDGRKTYYSCNTELVDQLMSFIPTRCKCMG